MCSFMGELVIFPQLGNDQCENRNWKGMKYLFVHNLALMREMAAAKPEGESSVRATGGGGTI